MVDVSDDRVVKYAGVSQVREFCHVLSAVKLGRVDLAHEILLEGLHLSIDQHGDLAGSLLRGESLQVPPSLETGHPDGLLRVVGLDLVGLLDVVRDHQPGRGVWLGSVKVVLVTRHGERWSD